MSKEQKFSMGSLGDKVPRVLHQTYKTEDTIPEHWKEGYERTKELCAKYGWEHRFWSDEDLRKLVEEHYPWFLPKYDSYDKVIQRVDTARSCILHHYGGVYMDLDLQAKDSLFKLLEMYEENEVVLSSNRPGNGVGSQNLTNAFMMTKPRSRFWHYVWRLYEDPGCVHPWKRFLVRNFDYYSVIMGTGPGTICDAAHLFEADGGKVVRIPGELTQPGYIGNPLPYDTEESVVKVLRGSSWHGKDAKFWNALRTVVAHKEEILGVLCLTFFAMFFVFMGLWLTAVRRHPRHRVVSRRTG